MSNSVTADWRTRQLESFATVAADLHYYVTTNPKHNGSKVWLSCDDGHKFRMSPHELVDLGKRCACGDRPRDLSGPSLADLVQAEEARYARQLIPQW